MAQSLVLLNDGTSYVLLNNGIDRILLNSGQGFGFSGDVPVADLRGIGNKKKKRVYKYPFELSGRVLEKAKLTTIAQVQNKVTFEALSKIYHIDNAKFYGRLFMEGSKLIFKSRTLINEFVLKREKKAELKKLLEDLNDI